MYMLILCIYTCTYIYIYIYICMYVFPVQYFGQHMLSLYSEPNALTTADSFSLRHAVGCQRAAFFQHRRFFYN